MRQNLLALVLAQGFKIIIMKAPIPFILLAALVLQASSVRAQVSSELEPVSLAVVDFRGVLAKSEAARNIRSAVDEKRQELRQYFLEVENNLRDEQKNLSKKRSLVTAEAFEQRARNLKEKAQSAQKLAQTSNQKLKKSFDQAMDQVQNCLLYTSPSPRDRQKSRMPSSA